MAELEAALYECIGELPGRQQDYIMAIAADYERPPTPTEIGDLFEVSPGSVRNRLFDARRKLEDCLRRKRVDIPWVGRGGSK